MPDVTIDPALSVYGFLQRARSHQALLNHRNTMLVVSREIETAIIQDGARARVFAGFQRMSRFRPQVKRYRRLAKRAESVYVFGVMDVKPPRIANVHYIPLRETDQLAREWFLVADAPEYFSALATQEAAPPGSTDARILFEGVWSFEEEIVTMLQEWLTSLVDAPPLDALTARRNYGRHLDIIEGSMFRLTTRMLAGISNPTPETMAVTSEVSQIVKHEVVPAVQTLAHQLQNGILPLQRSGQARPTEHRHRPSGMV
jgi:Sensory domain in DIguanylate Cyclases and Two-component system